MPFNGNVYSIIISDITFSCNEQVSFLRTGVNIYTDNVVDRSIRLSKCQIVKINAELVAEQDVPIDISSETTWCSK